MGIEPTRAARSELENMRFGAMPDAKCDGRVNFSGMWGHVGLRRDTSVGKIRGSSLPGVGLLPANTRHSSTQSGAEKRPMNRSRVLPGPTLAGQTLQGHSVTNKRDASGTGNGRRRG
jgi:hypothetical protein